ncbi:MAG: CotH kinase family protein [Ruminococcus sp.]|nr:CotH kinase family protein [Ruminococcus sp.]MBR4622916.1 CotH kinase family protein [Ruminococcus sp.]
MSIRALCRRFIGAASAVMMLTSFMPAISPGGYAFAEAEAFDLAGLADNGIPVLYISIDETAEGYGTIEEMNSSPDHSAQCTGTVRLDVPEGYTGDYSDTALGDTAELKLSYIRGRGHSTWGGDKKPYKFKLDKGADLLGMGKNKHWVLLANTGDDTLLKNRITSYIGSRLGLAYTPQMLPVDVVMNGDYLGNYYLSEQVRVGNSRVEIDELKQTDSEAPEVTGGYLLALGRKNDPEGTGQIYRHIITEGGNVFFGETPEFYTNYSDDETGTDAQFAYISDYLQKIEDAVLSDDFTDKNGVPVSEYLDLQSAASYWWVNNFLKNHDAFSTTSTYLYKARNGKLFYGPLWDFDQSMTGSSAEGFYKGNTLWLNRLRAYNAEYQQILFETWDRLDGIITDIVKEGGVLDAYADELRASEEDNEKRWEIKERYAEMGMEFDYGQQIEELRSWLLERQQWVRENVQDELTKARFRVTYKSGDEVIQVSEQDYMTDVSTGVTPPLKEGWVFIEWQLENGTAEDIPGLLTEDITLTARFIPEDEAVMAEDIYFWFYDVWFDLRNDGNSFSPDILVLPEDAQERVFEWSSSDPKVASVDHEGRVTPHKTGETVISVKLRNGVEKSYTFHVYDSEITPTQETAELILESETITLNVGEYGQIAVNPSPQPNTDNYLMYSADKEGVIELLDHGVFRAVAPGEVIVRVSNFDGVEAFCKIIVTEKAPDESKPDESKPDESIPDSKSDDSIPESKPESSVPEQERGDNPETGTAGVMLAAAAAAGAMIVIKKRAE